MIIKLEESDGIQIARFTDLPRFTLATTEEVKDLLKPVLSETGTRMILDLGNINFIDSSGIGCIIALEKTAKSNGSKMKITHLSQEVNAVFDLLHLQMILDIQPDLESALKSF
ncbi:MAG: STAS domain-containing protein [Culturomica sp.]|jgi:anti-anti-sigma factor|nr:STAS domain-containing protein [Culturomica sp.]